MQRANENKKELEEEVERLEDIVNQTADQSVVLEQFQAENEQLRCELEKEISQKDMTKEAMGSTCERLLQEKNLIQSDYQEIKDQLKAHSGLVKRQERGMQELLGIKEALLQKNKDLEKENQGFEQEVQKTGGLLREMTDAQQLTCSKFQEFQLEIRHLQSENKLLRDRYRSNASNLR